jgi:hypothetical protein
MFKGKKFVTNGVKDTIPQWLQNLLFYMINIMEVSEKDYLQVFELSSVNVDGIQKQKIIHSQEQPSYKNEEIINAKIPIDAKVYVIDEGEHCTMLLSKEY